MRRLLLLVSAILLVDTSFYAAITPLLPYYADQEHLTKTSAGILAGAYPAGTVLGALPSGWLAQRIGPRAMLAGGLGALTITSVTFGLADSILVLDLARFAQGIAGAVTWTGGMGWVSAAAPPERRGEMMGTAMAAATAGALLGPVIGAVARGIGTEVTFGLIGLAALVLLALVLGFEGERMRSAERGGTLGRALRQPVIARGLWIVACTALCFGLINVLLPLRIDAAGGGAAVIAFVYLVTAALETAINPLAGRRADRHGWAGVARFGLIGGAVVVVLTSLPTTVLPLVLVGLASGPVIGTLWTPGLVLLGEGSDAAGFDHTYAYALMNLAWAAAQTMSSAGGGALAEATSDLVPCVLVAAVALATALTLTRSSRRRVPART
jgi:MFS family permease